MQSIDFEESNVILGKPATMTDEQCNSLNVFTDGQTCVSCWELSDDELKKLMETKKIWLGVLSGTTQPPVFLTVEKPLQQVAVTSEN
jgi:hypothetical protein